MTANRKPWIGGNWKCNGTKESITALSKSFNASTFDANKIDVVICPTAIHIGLAQEALDKKFTIASQNVSKTKNGAFTGEISVEMLKDFGVHWTLIGHSERRQYYGEGDAHVGDKVAMCQEAGVCAGVCIGETQSERSEEKTNAVIQKQMDGFLDKVKDWSKIVIAYEPVWAIGTGLVATKEQAQEAHAFIRSYLKSKVDEKTAASVRIVYGGSVSDSNCKDLIAQPDIDGFLVGGASLKPSFVTIIESANSKC